jgi:hypothetical protein
LHQKIPTPNPGPSRSLYFRIAAADTDRIAAADTDGQPEKVLHAGDSLTVPDRVIHNEGATDKPVKLNAVYVLEKRKPLASPAP